MAVISWSAGADSRRCLASPKCRRYRPGKRQRGRIGWSNCSRLWPGFARVAGHRGSRPPGLSDRSTVSARGCSRGGGGRTTGPGNWLPQAPRTEIKDGQRRNPADGACPGAAGIRRARPDPATAGWAAGPPEGVRLVRWRPGNGALAGPGTDRDPLLPPASTGYGASRHELGGHPSDGREASACEAAPGAATHKRQACCQTGTNPGPGRAETAHRHHATGHPRPAAAGVGPRPGVRLADPTQSSSMAQRRTRLGSGCVPN